MELERTVYTEWLRLDDNLFYPYNPDSGELCDKGFLSVDVFCDGIANVSDGSKWGCINCLGELIIPIKYDIIKVETIKYPDHCIVCGRDGLFYKRGSINGRRKDSVYTGVYDLYNFNGNLLIGGFDEYKYIEDGRIFCFRFGCVFRKRRFFEIYEYLREDEGSKWVVLDEYYRLLLSRDHVEGEIFDWKRIKRIKIAGEVITDTSELNCFKNKRGYNSAFLIDLPSGDIFDQLYYNSNCSQLICKRGFKYKVIYLGNNYDSLSHYPPEFSNFFDYVKPLDKDYTCVLDDDKGIGLIRKGKLVLPCAHTHITKPVNNWCFAIKRYPYYPGSDNFGCYYAILLNVEESRMSFSESYLYDEAIVAIKRIECEKMVEKLLGEGVFNLYSLDEANDGIQSITVPRKYLHYFSKDFCELIGNSDKLNISKIKISRCDWTSRARMGDVRDCQEPESQYLDAIDNYSRIEDALEDNPDAYWNID